MATSGSVDWTVSRDTIIKAALRSIGAIATGETPSADEIAEASEALNFMVKGWQSEGIGIWLIDTSEITLVADQQSYTMGVGGDLAIVRPLEIIEARFYNATSTNETHIFNISWDEYMSYPDKATKGTPTNFHYKPNLALGVFYIWPVWDGTAVDTIRFSFKTEVEDFDAAANTPDFPKEWYRALKYNLAIELAPEYGKEPTAHQMRLAVESKFNSSAYDREKTSVYFALERR